MNRGVLLLWGMLLYSCASEPPASKSTDSMGPTPLAHPTAPRDTFWGYRFEVSGDFDGDGQPDTLRERFVDPETGWATFMSTADTPNDFGSHRYHDAGHGYWAGMGSTGATLRHDTHTPTDWLEATPDLNGDGRQEVLAVYSNQDYSNGNQAYLLTWDSTWRVLFQYAILEVHHLPDHPPTAMHRLPSGEPVLRRGTDKMARLVQQAPDAYTLLRPIGPQTFEIEAYDPCRPDGAAVDPSSGVLDRTGLWFWVAKAALPEGVAAMQVEADWKRLAPAVQRLLLERLEQGADTSPREWYDAHTAYRVRVTLE